MNDVAQVGRVFRGAEYFNCDDYTEEEMETIADWENAPKECKEALIKKQGWDKSRLFKRDAGTSMKCYVKVRVNDVDRTVEWREVEAEDLEQAVKIVERMPDVVAVWDASLMPGGIVT